MSNSTQCYSFPRRALLRPGLCFRRCLHFCVRRRAHGALAPAAVATAAIPSPPDEGWSGAPTGALFLSVAPATRDHPVPGRPGPLSALHRGGFRMRTHEAGSRQWNRSRSDCPRHAKRPGGRGPDLPSLRFAPQRGTPLPAPPSLCTSDCNMEIFRQVRFPSTLTYTLLLLQPLRKPHAIRRCWVPPGVAQERTDFPGRLHSGCTPVADSGGRSGTPPDFIEN